MLKDFDLVKRNVVEVVSEDALKKVLKKKKPRVYCGYEPNGPLHLGHFVTVTKLMDLEKAGFDVIVLLADVHALLNRKGSEREIKKEVENWRKTLKAIGLTCKVVLGSDFQFAQDYQLDVMHLAQSATINRGLRSMQEIARDFSHATISQLWYPLMQVVDSKHLKIDVALGGMEQRKVHMMGKDMAKTLGYDFVCLHTPLLTSFKGPGQKMSKSIAGSGISVTDSLEEITKTLKGAYCPEKESKENPILQIVELIIFPRFGVFEVKRPEKFGGDVKFSNYQALEKIYCEGTLHPVDLKHAVGNYLWKIIEPIRKKWKK